MKNETQMRSLISGHIDGLTVRRGSVYWTSRERARRHIDDGLAELAPTERPEAGPSERPEARPRERPEARPAEAPEVAVPEKKPRCLTRRPDWPVDRYSTVDRVWSGTAVCVATGPSLTTEQVAVVRASGVPVVTVNDAYLMAPFADVVYFADAKWWRWHKDRAEWRSFAGQKATIFTSGNSVDERDVHILRNARRDGLSTNPEEICTGSNSGYQAINVATLAGASRVILIGYDCKADGKKHHFFGDHPDKTMPPYPMIKGRFASAAEAAKKMGIEIVNATPGSALECFPRGDLASLLARP